MPRIDSSGLDKLDINDPADVQTLVDRGWAWRSGPKTLMRIFSHIMNGDVTRVPEKETPEVARYLDKVAPLPMTPGTLKPGETLPDPDDAPGAFQPGTDVAPVEELPAVEPLVEDPAVAPPVEPPLA